MSLDHFANVLQTSLKAADPFTGRSIHAQIIKTGLHFSVFLMNNLIHFYAKTISVSTARHLFDDMPNKNKFSWNTIISAYAKQGEDISRAHALFDEMPDRDSVSWTSMIVGYNQMGCFKKSMCMFLDMVSCQVWPSHFTITNILASCAATEALVIGKKVHSFAVKLGLSCNVPVANSLLNMYAKAGDPVTAKKVFGRMTLKSVSSWNAMITLHMQSGEVDHALAQFQNMEEKDAISWNSMIAGYNQHGFDFEALDLFCKMIVQSSLRPDTFTLASALSSCANLENLRLGKQIHGYIFRNQSDTSAVVGNALISMYCKSGAVVSAQKIVNRGASSLNIIAFTSLLDGYLKLGDMNPARRIFDLSKDRDVVAWTAMIVGYVQNGSHNEAIGLFKAMLTEGPRPNNFTLAAMLSVSSSLASLNHGKQIHASALRTGEVSSISVGNALITMYSKSGNINNAKCVFSQICLNRDTVTWTSMIIALAQHGRGDEAIDLFEKMLKQKIKPDHITYVGVLSACTHVGLVKQGRAYFSMMQTVHGVAPTISHYALMIDLFGRAGLLEEAHRFIGTMPIEPDVIAWGSLLSSCKVHKNVDLAKIAAEKLLLIDPENSGAYAALANVYSASRKWDEAAKIRKSMKDRKVKKEQGFSWVELKSKVHVFGVDDLTHPQRDAIYEWIAKIWKDIKKMGFVPDTESVLHDLDEELKEQLLKHHSEKLAIAFAILNTPKGATVRIMKNLRVCNDCHSAIKYISKLVDREIIVRDVTRFHHFKDGLCSCREYW